MSEQLIYDSKSHTYQTQAYQISDARVRSLYDEQRQVEADLKDAPTSASKRTLRARLEILKEQHAQAVHDREECEKPRPSAAWLVWDAVRSLEEDRDAARGDYLRQRSEWNRAMADMTPQNALQQFKFYTWDLLLAGEITNQWDRLLLQLCRLEAAGNLDLDSYLRVVNRWREDLVTQLVRHVQTGGSSNPTYALTEQIEMAAKGEIVDRLVNRYRLTQVADLRLVAVRDDDEQRMPNDLSELYAAKMGQYHQQPTE